MSRRLHIFVRGLAQPKGSKRAFTNPTTLRPIIVDANPKSLREWERDIRDAVKAAWVGPPLEGPVFVDLDFTFLPPKSASKRNPPYYKWTQPDKDKLERAVNDAMEGIVYRNDAQIADSHIAKHYGPEPGVWITAGALSSERRKPCQSQKT